jgi:hypothetical protein
MQEKNKNYDEKMTVHWHIELLSCLNHFLIDVTSFRLAKSLYSLSVPFKLHYTTNLVLLVQIVWIVEFTRPNSRHTSAFFFSSILHFSYLLKCSFGAQNLPFVRDCSHIVTLQVYYRVTSTCEHSSHNTTTIVFA